MKTIQTRIAAAVAAAVAVAALATRAADKPAAEPPPDKPAAKAKGPNRLDDPNKLPKTQTVVETVKLAEELAEWGRETENAAALALSAKILASVPAQRLKGDAARKTTKSGKRRSVDPDKKLDTPESLLAEAKALCGDDAERRAIETIEKMKVKKTRAAVGGATRHRDVVMTYDTDTYKIIFRGGEAAEIAVVGDGESDLDLLIYDEGRNLIVSDTDGADRCRVRWVPKWTGKFVIRIRNRGGVDSHYTLVTN